MKWFRVLRCRFDRMAMASAYAQAGEIETAKKVLDEEKCCED
jgi:hypothetical protein